MGEIGTEHTKQEEEEEEEEGVLDLRTQITSPQKTLIIMGNPASPATTSFDWAGGVEEVPEGLGRPRCEYLEKVEEVFQRSPVVEESKDLSPAEDEDLAKYPLSCLMTLQIMYYNS